MVCFCLKYFLSFFDEFTYWAVPLLWRNIFNLNSWYNGMKFSFIKSAQRRPKKDWKLPVVLNREEAFKWCGKNQNKRKGRKERSLHDTFWGIERLRNTLKNIDKKNGCSWGRERISRFRTRTVQTIFEKAGDKAGIEKDATFSETIVCHPSAWKWSKSEVHSGIAWT